MTRTFLCDKDTAKVRTDRGTVKGYIWNGITVFKGIPYAQAKRFHRPEKKTWDGVFDASNFGFVCPLLTNDRPNGELLVPHRYWPMNEDCQNLNIWTPALDGKKRPVLVWLHGGGYEAGSAIEHVAYEGENMARFGDCVVVTINHRLNVLGYFDLSEFGPEYENSGNAGGDDIIEALRFVHDNIALFGGDPENVTVFGQSGGGAKVTTLLQSPEADGLYQKGYNMSGVIGPVLADAVGSGKEMAEAMIKDLGLSGVRDLENVDCYLLQKSYVKLRPAFQKAGKYTGGAPHPNRFYKGEPVSCGWRKETADIPLLVGSCYAEFAGFTPAPWDKHAMSAQEQKALVEKTLGVEAAEKEIPLFEKAYPERPLADLLSLDFIFRSPEIDYLRSRAKINGSTYSYIFAMDQPINKGQAPWHCSDIPYVFHNTDLVPYPNGDVEASRKMEKEIFASVMAFARTGNPANDTLPGWKACTQEEENTMVLTENPGTRTNFDHELIAEHAKNMGPVFQKTMQAMAEGNQIQH